MSLFIRLIVSAIGKTAKLTLSGEAIDDSGAGSATAKLHINQDGTLDKTEGVTLTQIDAATDWIIPNGAAQPTYEFRFVSFTGSAFTTDDLGGENNWQALNSDKNLELVSSGANLSNTFTLEVRFGSGATITTGNYTMDADGTGG